MYGTSELLKLLSMRSIINFIDPIKTTPKKHSILIQKIKFQFILLNFKKGIYNSITHNLNIIFAMFLLKL